MIMRQLQSVAALAFIAVLIALLLILTVMVHMRNRKLKRTLEEQMAERRLLDKICADFTSVYYVELMCRKIFLKRYQMTVKYTN